jgi:hypothetical protein
MEKTTTHLQASMGMLCLLVKKISNEKELKNGIHKLMYVSTTICFWNPMKKCNTMHKWVSKNRCCIWQTTQFFVETIRLVHQV